VTSSANQLDDRAPFTDVVGGGDGVRSEMMTGDAPDTQRRLTSIQCSQHLTDSDHNVNITASDIENYTWKHFVDCAYNNGKIQFCEFCIIRLAYFNILLF